EPVGPGESVYIPEINATATYFEYEEQEMFLIIYGESKWLKEFFDVQLIVMNTDNETLEDCSATLDVPEGLTLCNSEQTQLIGDLLPYDVKNIHWYLRGDIAGEYNISVLSEGKNDGEIFSYPFYSENDIHVYAGDALKMTIETHGYSCFGSEYPICISMQNVSDKPIYQLQNKIKNVVHGYYNYKHVNKNGTNQFIETKVPLGGSLTKTIDVDELLPGESAVIEISITDMWKSPLQKELDNSKLYVDAFSLLLGKSPISAFIANYTSQFIEGITVVHVLDSYVVTTLKNSTTKVPYEIVINDNLNEIGEDNTFGFVDAIECSIMDQAPNEVKRIYAAGKCFESGFEFRSDFKANLLEDWQKVENGEMSRESFDKKYDKEYNDYIFGNAGNEATVSGFDMAGHLEVGKDIYKIVSIPSDVTTATAYVTDADGNIIDKDSSRQDVMGKIHTAAFEFEILNGGFEYNDGVYTFYEDSLIRLRANSANKTYYVHFVTDDGREEVFPFISIAEHDCTAERYYVVSGTGSGNDGLAMQFCEVCNKPLKTRRIPSSFNAMLSDGQMFQNIYQAAAFAEENYYEIELSIFGDITLDKDLVIPENVKLIITPFANITLKNSAHIVVDGEYKDFSTDMDTEIYENIVLNYWDGRTETMPVKYGTEVTELPVLSETCGFTGWYTDAEFTEPFVPFTSGDKNHSKVYYADVHHSFDTSGQCSVCGEIKNGMDAFRKVALSIDDDIEILYHVALTEKALADNQFRVTFEASDGTTKTQYLSDAVDNGDGTYTFSYSIPYNKFDENIRAQVCYSNNVKGSYLDYSAKKYADSILENSDQFDEVTVNNIKALVNFSGYVQIFAGTAPEDAVNADLEMPLDDVDPEIGDEFNAVKNINSDSISIAAANLSMDKLTNINIKFNISAGANVNDYIFTVDGKAVTPKQSGSSYLVTMEGISPLNFDKMYLFKAESKSDASDFVSVEYSCLTYAKKIIETSSDANVVNAMKALYFYSQEAEKYISKTKED
ncbi:MAG: InlB B-repeat-containing protein, partial [Ruminococcus sp.]|nr:InlB B-repeat-containing protein [Ruminococcus sp.]